MARPDNIFQLRGETSYSQAVEAGPLIHVAGTVSWDDDFNVIGDGDFELQVRTVYNDIKRTLAAYGLTASSIVKETVFVTDMDAMVAANAVRASFYETTSPPASTWVEVKRLANSKLAVEVEVIAVRT
jgi:enamine deaminase RidA (YjgF/YER057c/UK114 family)